MVNSEYEKRPTAFDLADDCIYWQGRCIVKKSLFSEEIEN